MVFYRKSIHCVENVESKLRLHSEVERVICLGKKYLVFICTLNPFMT